MWDFVDQNENENLSRGQNVTNVSCRRVVARESECVLVSTSIHTCIFLFNKYGWEKGSYTWGHAFDIAWKYLHKILLFLKF